MNAVSAKPLSPAEITLAYHGRTKHRLDRYAAGPETLDWDAQPNPFRDFLGCPRIPLLLSAQELNASFAALHEPGEVAPAPPSLKALGALLELSLGLSAWKEYGPDRWALRCNPSSGNLHPTEAYVLSRNLPGLPDGLYHYVSRDHVLEQRAAFTPEPAQAKTGLWIALSSIHWREAWKYGERAFRYCQLDVGHALGALRYAAGALGWTLSVTDDRGSADLAALLGLNRKADFDSAEREEPEALIAVNPGESGEDAFALEPAHWMGKANRLDPHPLYRWPIIDDVSHATRAEEAAPAGAQDMPAYPPPRHRAGAAATPLILNRRSAQRFDAKYVMTAETFYGLLDALLWRPALPFDLWDAPPRCHPILFVHRVDGVEPGLYALPRHPRAEQDLRDSLSAEFVWERHPGAPAHLPLFKLLAADCRAAAKTVSCHQAIASDGCFSLAMLCAFDPLVRDHPELYRHLHWEAGLLGHVLYLEAEAAGLRGTGIGCFFDDAVHELVGLASSRFQTLYHFTVGRPLTDGRITSLPAYPGRRGTLPKETQS